MTLLIRKASLRLVLTWAQRGLFSCALVLLSYCGFILVDTWMFQHRERLKFERLLEHQSLARVDQPALVRSLPGIGPDGLIGRLDIPRIGISAMVVEGTDMPTLRRAAGHIIGTGLPGQRGNVGI